MAAAPDIVGRQFVIAEKRPPLESLTIGQCMPTLPRVTAIISNFNGAKYLPRLLESLDDQQGVELEVIVVDRNSSDDSDTILAANPHVKVVKEAPESGLVTGYSVGAEHATSDLLFFCNEDMWFDSDCLRLLAGRVDPLNRVAAADPWQWTYDGEMWIHGGTRFRPTRLDLNCPYPFRAYDFTVSLADGAAVPFACAGAVMIHRSIYQELGGWDRSFFLDHEDVDFFLRAWQARWICVTVPSAKVYHAVNVSNAKSIKGGKQTVSRRRYISGRSSVLVLGVKYFSPLYVLLLIVLWIGTTTRHVVSFKPTRFWWSLLAGKEFLMRLPAALRHRRTRTQPKGLWGEHLFTTPDYQACESVQETA